MKKLFTLLIAFVFISLPVFSQENADSTVDAVEDLKTEVYVGYGSPSTIPIVLSIFSAIGGALSGADEVEGDMSGVVYAGVNCYLQNWLLVGGYASYESFEMSYDNKKNVDLRFFTLQARLIFQYGFERFKFYHGLNAGLCFTNGGQNDSAALMGGLTPLGIKIFPTEQLSVFVETGLISNAFLSAGIGYRF